MINSPCASVTTCTLKPVRRCLPEYSSRWPRQLHAGTRVPSSIAPTLYLCGCFRVFTRLRAVG